MQLKLAFKGDLFGSSSFLDGFFSREEREQEERKRAFCERLIAIYRTKAAHSSDSATLLLADQEALSYTQRCVLYERDPLRHTATLLSIGRAIGVIMSAKDEKAARALFEQEWKW